MFAVSEFSQRTLVSIKLCKPHPKKAASCGGTPWECCSVTRDRLAFGPEGGLIQAAWDVGQDASTQSRLFCGLQKGGPTDGEAAVGRVGRPVSRCSQRYLCLMVPAWAAFLWLAAGWAINRISAAGLCRVISRGRGRLA